MNAEDQKVFDALSAEMLPPGWSCEKEFGCEHTCEHATHLVAPKRAGGVVVKWRQVHVQLPGDGGPCSDRIEVGEFKGRDWLPSIVRAAVDAAFAHADRFPQVDGHEIRGKLGTHSSAVYERGQARCLIAAGDRIYVRSEHDPRVSRWTRVFVVEVVHFVDDHDFYRMSLL